VENEKANRIVVVGGGGHVGLPLCLILANAGFQVTAYDVSTPVVEMLNSGSIPFIEKGAENLLHDVLKTKNFIATDQPDCLTTADTVIIVIGTPVDEHLSPDPNVVVKTIEELSPYLNSNQLLILRSTIFPGVSKRVSQYLSKTFPGIDLAYCPERIVEGNALFELTSLPQIIGTSEEHSFLRASHIFEQLGVTTVKCSMEEAELAKLYTNVWRYIKFATANQFWMMSNDLNVDYENVRHAISFEYPRAADLPGAGFAAGPCLFKDTMQLSALVQQNFPLGHSAMMINEGTPGYIVSRLEQKFELNELTVGILGMAFKGDVDDVRSSLAFKLRKLLAFRCKEVLMHDPYVLDQRFVSYEEIIEKSDLLIIGAPHSLYKALDIKKPVVDIWNLLKKGVLI